MGLALTVTSVGQAATIVENFDDGDDPPVTLGTTWIETDSAPWSVQADGSGYDYQFARSGGAGYSSSSMYTVSDRMPETDFTVSVDVEIDSLGDTHLWPGIQLFGPEGTGYRARWTARHSYRPDLYEGLLALDKAGTSNVGLSTSQLAYAPGTTYTLTVDGTYDPSGNLTLDASLTDGTSTITTSYTDTSPLSGTDFGLSAFQYSASVNADFDDFQIDYIGGPDYTVSSITTADGNGADAWVQGETTGGTTNHGADDFLTSQDYDVTNSTMSFLRFDTSGITQPLDWAELNLVAKWGGLFRVYGLKDSEDADDWGEMTITYQNAPGLTFVGRGSSDVDLTKADLLGTITNAPAGTTVSFTGADLASFIESDTDGLVTFILTDNYPDARHGAAVQWWAKENATYDPPTLVVYEVPDLSTYLIPEPCTCLIWSLGLLGLAAYARRRRTK